MILFDLNESNYEEDTAPVKIVIVAVIVPHLP
jgi:hypothetical protein